jgi:Fe-S-cluster-containing hydrogenase component 2
MNPVIGSCDYCGIPLCETHARELKQSVQSEIYCGNCLIYLQTSGMDKRPTDRKVIPNLLVINSKKCTGCRSCELACSFEHYKEFSYELSAIKVLKFEERARSYPLLCLHCENPPCVDVCPTNALLQEDGNGMVVLNEEECNLCGRCIEACPFEVIFFNSQRKKVIKCDLCTGDPACAKVCAPEAIEWVKKFKFGERRKIVLNMNPYSKKEN